MACNLKRIRKEKGLNQKELAELAGINPRIISKYESGEKNINHACALTVWRLAKALGVEMKDVLEVDAIPAVAVAEGNL